MACVAAFFPLGLAVFTVPWVIALAVLSIGAPEWYRNDPAREMAWRKTFTALSLAPSVGGFFLSVVLVLVLRRRWTRGVVLLGALACMVTFFALPYLL